MHQVNQATFFMPVTIEGYKQDVPATCYLTGSTYSTSLNMSSSKPKEFKGQLLKLREARRLADHDAQLLANRIALLEAEEAKAWKKIKQTKVRAETILTKRQQHQQEKQQTRRAVLANRNGAGRPKQRSYVDKSVNDALHRK